MSEHNEHRMVLRAGDVAELCVEVNRSLYVSVGPAGEWQVHAGAGQRVEFAKAFGPTRAARLRLRCSTDRGWVIEREVRQWGTWVEWCVVPRLMPVDWPADDEYAFVDEEYADYERDYSTDLPPHAAGQISWDEVREESARAEQWRRDMGRIRPLVLEEVEDLVQLDAATKAELSQLWEELGGGSDEGVDGPDD